MNPPQRLLALIIAGLGLHYIWRRPPGDPWWRTALQLMAIVGVISFVSDILDFL